MKVKTRTTHDQEALLPENVAAALGVRDGDEVEVVVRNGESLLRKVNGQSTRVIRADTLPSGKAVPAHFSGRTAGAAPDTAQVVLFTQRLLKDFARLGDARRDVPTARLMTELRGYDEYDEASLGDNGGRY